MEEMTLIRNEQGLIKVYPLGNNAYQMYPEIDDMEYVWATDEQLEKLINEEYIVDADKKEIVINYDKLREKRKILLQAFDTYKANVNYGIEVETNEQKEEIITWYKLILDLDIEAMTTNIPERIKYYL